MKAKLRFEQPLIDLDAAVGIFYSQIKKHFRLWKKKNYNQAFTAAKSCGQAKAFYGGV